LYCCRRVKRSCFGTPRSKMEEEMTRRPLTQNFSEAAASSSPPRKAIHKHRHPAFLDYLLSCAVSLHGLPSIARDFDRRWSRRAKQRVGSREAEEVQKSPHQQRREVMTASSCSRTPTKTPNRRNRRPVMVEHLLLDRRVRTDLLWQERRPRSRTSRN
jgi:hypothetical protein